MANYKTEADALAGAGLPGWTVTGREAEFENVSGRDENNQPTTTKQRTGNTILTVQSPDGKRRDTITVGSADDPDVKGGKVITVVKGAQTQLPAGNQPSTPSGWTPVYRVPGDPSSGQIGQWDPANNEFHPQAGDPSAKPSGQYTNVIDPNDPKGKRVIGMIDTGDASWHAVSSDPNLPGRQIITTPTAVYAVDADNKVSKLVDIDKDSPFQAVIVDGKPFKFDPKTGTFTAGPVNEHPDIKDQNGLTMVWQADAEGGGKYGYPPGVKPAAGLSVNTQAKQLVWYDTEGNIVAQRDNPNYTPTPATAPSPNTTAPMLLLPDPKDPTKLTWQENKGQVVASDALKQLASHLTGQVVDGKISVDEAKTLIDSANARMTNDINAQQNVTTAATNAISGVNQAATTGAGLLQNRVTNAMSGFNTAVGAIAGSKMTSAPAGMGANLVGGLKEWVTGLGGGQAVYDSAAAMVNQANPAIKGDPTIAQQAYTALRGAMDLYKQQTGKDYVPPAQREQTGFQAPPTPAPPAPVRQPLVAAGVQAPAAQVPGQNYGLATTGNPINPATGQPYPTWLAPPGPAIPYIPNQFQAPVTV